MDILPESLIYSNLGKIGMVVFFCHHHLKFYTLASLGQDDILQFFLCFRIIYIGFSKEILEFDVENRFTGLAIVFGNRLLEHLFENTAGLTYDHLPAGYNLLQILGCCLLRCCCHGFCTAIRSDSCTSGVASGSRLNKYLLNRPLVHALFQNTKTIQDRIQIGLHRRTAQFDQGNLHQNTLLGGIAYLTGQVRKNTDVAHQRLYIHHLTFFS